MMFFNAEGTAPCMPRLSKDSCYFKEPQLRLGSFLFVVLKNLYSRMLLKLVIPECCCQESARYVYQAKAPEALAV